ncbi:MAG TPA: fumarate reductase subunit FrdD [Thermoanaerobaculia bacterium]|nr:fumarate reductase subunit FrdD [Thermoanaerobaculia bacterium]
MRRSRRSSEPFFWALFSSGGMLAALVMPALALCLWVARPLGWVDFADLAKLSGGGVGSPLVRLFVFVVISLALFHWAHRFRYTLYDGLQLAHLYGLIATLCYGGATLLTVLAAWVLLRFP